MSIEVDNDDFLDQMKKKWQSGGMPKLTRQHEVELTLRLALHSMSDALAFTEAAAHKPEIRNQAYKSRIEASDAIAALAAIALKEDECTRAALLTLESLDCTWAGPGATRWSVPTGTFAHMRDLVLGSRERDDESLTSTVHRAGQRACRSLGGTPDSPRGRTWVAGWMSAFLVFGGQHE